MPKEVKHLAIIPARGGSKRIPQKNVKDFLSKPIIEYSITAAKNAGLFDEIMVSTDDKEIADISIKCGAKVPFMRSEETANDYAGIADVLFEVLQKYSERCNDFDYFCCVFATAPFIKPERLVETFNILKQNNYSTVFPVVRFSYPIQRALKIENAKVSMIWPENYDKRSQDLMPAYHDAGQFYWAKTQDFLNEKTLFSSNSGAIVLPETEVQDIDTPDDWQIAEMKYEILQRKGLL